MYSTFDNTISLGMVAKSIKFKYISYRGSITSPPCNEAVTWIVAVNKTVKISEQDMDVFHNIKLMADYNFRGLQHLNDRKFYCSSTN
jgi:carbonic anhydrase